MKTMRRLLAASTASLGMTVGLAVAVAVAVAITVALAVAPSAAQAADGPVKVVYHIADGKEQASRAIVNLRNHLDADPSARIVVVGNGEGIDFMLEGAKDTKGQPYSGYVGELANRGVQFRVCENTLEARGIDKGKVALEATLVRSGVAEVARLQAKEGYVYLRP